MLSKWLKPATHNQQSRFAPKTLALLAIFAASYALPSHALNVFVCEPEWGALVRAHAPHANIYAATTSRQDPHYVQARPSLISQMRRADLAVCSGAELEIGWLPMLQARSNNAKVQDGQSGMFYASEYVAMLDTHDHVDRSMGDIHAHGNPHVQFAVKDMPRISTALTARLVDIDPDNARQYQANGIRFRGHWHRQITQWEEVAEPLQGLNVVGYHGTYRYLFDWLGIAQVGDLEPKPGLSPTNAHIHSLAQLGADAVDLIVYSSHQDSRPASWLQQRIDKPVLELPLTVEGDQSLTEMIDIVIGDLLKQTGKQTHLPVQ
ncbi:metal ABC transporter solute-binding protein, Zn/Mn family [Thaumasiovibrio subtropicus]|uniref:metal ABC transporter solute-binding protein, Zn/Mn family n=1 Tax=Thaumasiovibrio subtropicus TaxID=1891207 RepID=UPI000B356233|nr:zinc ABC transporter substrate-binding protein [Thaumasiovibrio subtropicus]